MADNGTKLDRLAKILGRGRFTVTSPMPNAPGASCQPFTKPAFPDLMSHTGIGSLCGTKSSMRLAAEET